MSGQPSAGTAAADAGSNTTTFYPIVVVIDPTIVRPPYNIAAVLPHLSSQSTSSIVVINRSDIEAGSSDKSKKAGAKPSKSAKLPADDVAAQSKPSDNALDAALCNNVKDRIDGQLTLATTQLADRRKKELDEARAPTKTDGKKGKADKKTEEKVDAPPVVLKTYPPRMPLFVILVDCVQVSADIQRLKAAGVIVDVCIVQQSSLPTDSSSATTDLIHPHYATHHNRRPQTLSPLFDEIYRLALTELLLRDCTIIEVNLIASTTTAAPAALLSVEAATPLTPKSPKTPNKDPKKPISNKKEEDPTLPRFAMEIAIALRDFASAKSEFAQWKSAAKLVSIDVATANSCELSNYDQITSTVPIEQQDLNVCLYAMFEHVAATTLSSELRTSQLSAATTNDFALNLRSAIDGAINNADGIIDGALLNSSPRAHEWSDGHCLHCGLSTENAGLQPTPSACLATIALIESPSTQSITSINEPTSSTNPVIAAAAALYRKCGRLPGVDRLGMPSLSSLESTRVDVGIELTMRRGQSHLEAALCRRAAICVEFESMLNDPQFVPFNVSHSVAVDNVSGMSGLHTDYIANRSPIHHAVMTRVAATPAVSDEGRRQWIVNDRQWRQELSKAQLQRAIAESLDGHHNDVQAFARYVPLYDELLLVCKDATPSTRQRTKEWSLYLTPNMTLQQFINASPNVRSTVPKQLFAFRDPHYTGEIAIRTTTLYAADQGKFVLTTMQSGLSQWRVGTVSTAGLTMTLEEGTDRESRKVRVKVDRPPPAVVPVVAAPSPEPTVSEKKEKNKKDTKAKAIEKVEPVVAVIPIEVAKPVPDEPIFEERIIVDEHPIAILTSSNIDGGVFSISSRQTPDNQSVRILCTDDDGRLYQLNDDGAVELTISVGGHNNAKPSEVRRLVTSDGAVQVFLSDNSERHLLSDGRTGHRSADGTEIVWTDRDGHQTSGVDNATSNKIPSLRQVDALTGAISWLTADNAVFIQYNDKSTLVCHNDGTRIFTDPTTNGRRIHIEHESFCPITFTHQLDHVNVNIAMNKMTLNRDGNANITTITQSGCHRFVFDRSQSKVVYCRRDETVSAIEPAIDYTNPPANLYIFDLTRGRQSIYLEDDQANLFQVNLSTGSAKCTLSRARADNSDSPIPAHFYDAPTNPIPPRLFVIRGNGGGYELLDNSIVEGELKQSGAGRRIQYQSMNDGTQCVHIITNTYKRPTKYIRKPVIPAVIRASSFSLSCVSPSPSLISLTSPQSAIIESADTFSYRSFMQEIAVADSIKESYINEQIEFAEWKAAYAAEMEKYRSLEEIAKMQSTDVPRNADVQRLLDEMDEMAKASAAALAAEQAAPPPIVKAPTGSAHTLPRPLHTLTDGETVAQTLADAHVRRPPTFFHKKSSTGPDFASFPLAYRSRSFRQQVHISSFIDAVDAISWPNNTTNIQMTAEDKEARLAKLSPADKETVLNDYRQRQQSFGDSIKRVLDECNYILQRPYDVAARSMSVTRPPLSDVISQNAVMSDLISPLMHIIGFERERDEFVLCCSDDQLHQNIASVRRECKRLLPSEESPLPPHAIAIDSLLTQTSKFDVIEVKSQDDDRHIVADVLADEEYKEQLIVDTSSPSQSPSPSNAQRTPRRVMIRSQPTTVHSKRGGTFKYTKKAVAAAATLHIVRPHKPTESAWRNSSRLAQLDITGQPRTNPISLPPTFIPNIAPTSSDASSSIDFILQPSNVDFGLVRRGDTYRSVIALTNVGAKPARFTVIQPTNDSDESNRIRVLYRPGPLAAGMQKRLEVEVFAGSIGLVSTTVTIQTENGVFTLPIRAEIVKDCEFERLSAYRATSPSAIIINTNSDTAIGSRRRV